MSGKPALNGTPLRIEDENGAIRRAIASNLVDMAVPIDQTEDSTPSSRSSLRPDRSAVDPFGVRGTRLRLQCGVITRFSFTSPRILRCASPQSPAPGTYANQR
jgi:hypothetical protein